MRLIGCGTLSALVSLMIGASASQAAEPAAAQPAAGAFAPVSRVPGLAVLKLYEMPARRLAWPRADDDRAQRALKDLSARTHVDVSLVRPTLFGWALVQVRDARTRKAPDEPQTLALIERLRADTAVEAVVDNRWLRPLTTPNDPGFSDMWHLSEINAESAWDVTRGVSSQRIGVVDTGLIRGHEDVGHRAVAGYDFISGDNSTDGNGRDPDYQDTGDACPQLGSGNTFHGTHVAGTIGAGTDNGLGISGVNWNAGLVIVRALGACGGNLVDIMEGAAWLAGAGIDGVPGVGANKVSVMNLSLGSADACDAFSQDVIDFIDGEGVVFVAASGNDGGPVGSPANCNGVIAVAAHGPNRALTGYSSFGPEIDVVGPGGDQRLGRDQGVLSTLGPGNGDYAYYEGTSMAAPHVAGVVSLLQALDPTIHRAQAEALFAQNGGSCSGCEGKPALDANAVVRAVTPTTPPPDPEPTPTDDDLEENDSAQEAQRIECGNILELVAGENDQDWFIVEADPGRVQVSLSASNGADLDLYLLKDPQNRLAASETDSGEENIDIEFSGGDAFVVVSPYVNNAGVSAAGAYSLTVSCTENGVVDPGVPPPPPGPGVDPDAAEDALEDNDAADAAREISCGEVRDLTLRDDDWFVIEVRDGDVLDARFTGVSMQVSAVDGDGRTLATSTNRLLVPNLPAGAYFIHVAQDANQRVGTYRMVIGCQPTLAPVQVSGGCSSHSRSHNSTTAVVLMALALLRRRRWLIRPDRPGSTLMSHDQP